MDETNLNANQEADLEVQEQEAKKATEGQAGQKDQGQDKEGKTFSQEDVTAIVEARLARERAKMEKEAEKKVASAKKEAERLAKLSEEERQKEEDQAKDKALAEAKAELARVYLERDTVNRLSEEKIPTDFKDFLMGADAEATNENIKAFKPVFESMVQREVEERLKGKTPKRASQAGKPDVWAGLKDKYKKG